jgi:hypothetical protein
MTPYKEARWEQVRWCGEVPTDAFYKMKGEQNQPGGLHSGSSLIALLPKIAL